MSTTKKTFLFYCFSVCYFFCFAQKNNNIYEPFLSQKDRSFPFLVFSPTDNNSVFTIKPNLAKTASGFQFNSYKVLVNLKVNVFKKLYTKGNFQLAVSGLIDNQFVFREERSERFSGITHSLFNTDYFLYLHNDFVLNEHNFLRINLFHRSSHLGDDFLLKNEFTTITNPDYWANDPSNYETIEVLYAFNTKNIGVYTGVSYIIRTDSNRKKLTLQTGGVFKNFRSQSKFWQRVFIGYDVRFLENNNFNADFNGGIGYAFRNNNSLRLEYYNGHLPYSRLEREVKTSWVSLAYYYNLEL
ncbi:DUF1207 domain-containing protein [uncultured Polaribacter sp.]|uniref:DUF1207 domain-containing protein n=1 Tax=uncultured Polaribacter sp. TaxID=174711 RepID=UPI002625175D|nr:DUF1207 domain-containing protein [uncultured Polaribacter sp.]